MYDQPSYYRDLIAAGLTQHQAKLYEAIVREGKMAASEAANAANVPRTLAYKALNELQTMGLVFREDAPGKVAVFSPAHPYKVRELVEKRYLAAKEAKNSVENMLSKLISEFNTVSGLPGIRIIEGAGGIGEVLEDQLNEGQLIRLIRSPYDISDNHPELDIEHYMAELKRARIPRKVLTPLTPRTMKKVGIHDKEMHTERRILPAKKLDIRSQVSIYANKVALVAFDGQIITTIIENVAIRQTFEILFDYIWEAAAEDHRKTLVELGADT